MNRLKQCLLAGLISCFLAVPCLSLADDVTLVKGDGQGAIALQTHGESELLQAVRAKDYEKALQIVNGQRLQNIPMMPMLTTAAARFTASSDGMTKPWPIAIKPFPWNRARPSIISTAAPFTNSAKNTCWPSTTIRRPWP